LNDYHVYRADCAFVPHYLLALSLRRRTPLNARLTHLQQLADEVAATPELWMPWNYRAALT
jgi:hypothetical protein